MLTQHVQDRTVSARALRSAADVVMGSTDVRDAALAEEILQGLALRLGRPLQALAEDLASGRDFAGRPAWL
jgi:hypothetical protein